MIRSELRALASKFCEDPNITKFTADKYNDSLEKAQQQFSMDSKALYKDQSIVVAIDTAAYALASDFMLEKEVVFNGLALLPISRATLQVKKTEERWDDDKGTPKYYIIDPEEGRKTITLYPTPDNVDAGTSLVLTYYCFPTAMTSDSSIPLNSSTLMVQFHIGLAAYASWLLMFYLTQTAEIQAKRNELFAIYTAKVAEAIQTFGNTKSEPLRFHVGNVRTR